MDPSKKNILVQYIDGPKVSSNLMINIVVGLLLIGVIAVFTKFYCNYNPDLKRPISSTSSSSGVTYQGDDDFIKAPTDGDQDEDIGKE